MISKQSKEIFTLVTKGREKDNFCIVEEWADPWPLYTKLYK
jgi:hypothetical protein